MAERLKQIITVHGANTKGGWQEALRSALEPHFECIPIKYSNYRWFGGTKILLDPYVMMLGILISLYLARARPSISMAISLLATLTVALLVSCLRRIRTLRIVKSQLDELKVPSGVPHVIAHSLGTFLVGGIIEKFPDIRLDRLILTGCVLKRSTPWAEYLRRNPKAVKSVRNEMAGRDIVSKLAVVFCGFFPGLGHAGISGFTDYSHNIEPNSGCDIECAALVHNVSLRDLSHSDVFVGPGHARRFWLPFLWGLDPKDYEEFMEMCQLANESERLGFVKELGIVEDELRNRPWRWTNNLTLNDYLKEQIECLLKRKGVRPLRDRIRRMRDLAVAEMWHTIAQAYAIQDTGLGDPLILRNLHPKIAAAHAVRSVEA